MVEIVQGGRALYSATAQTGKHTDPVWQVRWAAAEGQRGLQFFSISTDGRFTLWTLAKNELIHQVCILLSHLRRMQRNGWQWTGLDGLEAPAVLLLHNMIWMMAMDGSGGGTALIKHKLSPLGGAHGLHLLLPLVRPRQLGSAS